MLMNWKISRKASFLPVSSCCWNKCYLSINILNKSQFQADLGVVSRVCAPTKPSAKMLKNALKIAHLKKIRGPPAVGRSKEKNQVEKRGWGWEGNQVSWNFIHPWNQLNSLLTHTNTKNLQQHLYNQPHLHVRRAHSITASAELSCISFLTILYTTWRKSHFHFKNCWAII